MADNLKAFRKSLKLSQKEFASSLGLSTTTYNNYETGTRQPRSDFWISAAQRYGVSVDYLMGYTDDPAPVKENKNSAPSVSEEALKIARQYDDASPVIQAAVKAVLAAREAVQKPIAPVVPVKPLRKIPYFNAAAGSGDPAPDIAWDYYETDNQRADFAIHVVGNSMDPLLPDGSVALGIKRMPYDGEVGAFRLDGQFLVKQVCQDDVGNIYLFSTNRKRKDADQIVWHDSGRDLWCFGTILCAKVPLPRD